MSSVNDSLPLVDPSIAGGDSHLTPGARAICVDCDTVLIAKCGEINRWHWAHEAGGSWCVGSDGEGAWHRAWKLWAEQHGAQTEVTEGRHRADIVWHDGGVYELQSGYLDPVDIRSREDHWGDALTWIYRMTPGRHERLINIGDGWFKWRRPAISMARHERPVIWHMYDRLYDVTLALRGGDVLVRFKPGEPDEYGPVMYGSRPAPFDLTDSIQAANRFRQFVPERGVS